MLTKQEQLNNLNVLMDAAKSTPDIDLNQYKKRDDTQGCGTLYCLAGLVGVMPYFTEMGVCARQNGAPYMPEGDHGIDGTLDHLFGEFDDEDWGAYHMIFAAYGNGEWDKEILKEGPLTHKQLAIARLNKAIYIRGTEIKEAT